MGAQPARAGGWSTAGKVLTGIFAFDVFTHVVAPRAVYSAPAYPCAYAYPAPAYSYSYRYAPPIVYSRPVYAPAPVVYAAPAPVVYAAPRVVTYAPPVVYAPVPYVGVRVGPVRVGF